MLRMHNRKHIEMFTLLYFYTDNRFSVVANCAFQYHQQRSSHFFILYKECTKIGIFAKKMMLRKIIKITATKCHILKLKCIKFDFGWGSAQGLQ